MTELSTRAVVAVPAPRTSSETLAPVAAAAPDVVRQLGLAHDAMRSAVGLFAHAATGLQPGRSPRATELAHLADTLAAVLRHHHDVQERHWWPSLQRRSPEATQALGLLTDDDRDLEPLLEVLGLHAVLLRAGSHDARAVRRHARVLREHLGEHLAVAGPVLSPLLDRLDPQEAERLARLDAETAPRDGLSYVLGALDDAAGRQEQRVVLAALPLQVRLRRPLLLRRYRKDVAVLTAA